MPIAPHSPGIVPSSTSVTSGEATSSPFLPRYTLAPLPTRSASRPCPQASWNSTPPLPRWMTTGSEPLGAGRAPSLVSAWRAASRRQVARVEAVEHLVAVGAAHALVAGLHPGVATGDRADPHHRPHLLVGGQDAVGVGDEDPLARVGVAGRHLDDRPTGRACRVVDAAQQGDAIGLGHLVRVALHRADAVARRVASGRSPAPRRRPGWRRPRRPRRRPAGRARTGRRCGRTRWSHP